MNILHITTYLQGGAGQAIAEIACAQGAAGHHVTVVTSRNPEGDCCNYPQWMDRIRHEGVSLILADSTFRRNVASVVNAFSAICGALDCTDLGAIHTHAAVPSLLALLIRSRLQRRVPILQTMHGWGIRKTPEQAAADVGIMNQLDQVVTPSHASRRLLESLGVAPERIAVVPYGLPRDDSDLPAHLAMPMREWKQRDLGVLVCIGTIGERKNQRLIIDALASPDAPRTLACTFVGEGAEIPELKSAAEIAGIGDRVHFYGLVPCAARFLTAADWLILPSLDEGLPISVLEAFRAGVPVLGSDIPEIAEAVSHGKTGLLFNPRDLGSLLDVLKAAADMDECKRSDLAANAHRQWQERYTLGLMLNGYEVIYRKLLNGWDGHPPIPR
jgi:L-malate glycosyltransferase